MHIVSNTVGIRREQRGEKYHGHSSTSQLILQENYEGNKPLIIRLKAYIFNSIIFMERRDISIKTKE